jgi:hypothetical protein
MNVKRDYIILIGFALLLALLLRTEEQVTSEITWPEEP